MTMRIISVVLLSFLSHLTILIAQEPFRDLRYASCFNEKGNYTNTSAYHTNLSTLLSDLTSNTKIDYGFYNVSRGQDPDRVSAMGLCRGDVKTEECRNCLNNASNYLPKLCPNQKEAIGGFDECVLRYSNRSILGVLDDDFALPLWNPNNASDVAKFNQVVSKLLDRLRAKAAGGDSLRKFAAANDTGPSFQTVFAAVQCTPDLSEQDCTNCLVKAIAKVPDCCETKRGGRVIKPSCNIRYENYRFYHPIAEDSPQASPLLPPPAPISTSQGNNGKLRTIIVVFVSIIVAVILLLISTCIYFRVRKTKTTVQLEAENDGEIKPTESLQFDFQTFRLATDNFSDANKLGQGGFGSVYKGRLYNGQEVAVKRLSKDSGQGDTEFKNEVLLVAKLQHRNLVRLLGFCLERKERLLVYEFLSNRSLDYLLFDLNQRAQLSWDLRYKIIGGIARGLLYLHEDSRLRIIHRDLKASNILLDEELNPKISDFGMARLFLVDQTQTNTSKIVGTYGYIAPEYAMHGQFSMKSDVFSFGVLILEIVSGKKNSSIFHGENAQDLVSFAWKNWREGTALNIVDPAVNNGPRNEIIRCIHIGLLCVQENAAERPTTTSVALMLSSHSLSLPLPSQPPLLRNNINLSEIHLRGRNSGGARSSEHETNSVQASSGPENSSPQESVNELSITDLFPR